MNKETMQKYKELLDHNKAFSNIKSHPIVQEILKNEDLRFWIPEPTNETVVDDSVFWDSRQAKNIIAFLEIVGYTVNKEDRTASNDGGKNNRKIGKILTEYGEKSLINAWKKMTNGTAVTTKGSKRKWVISANPVDIVNATYGRKWTSCLSGGTFFTNNIPYNRFSFIAYLCNSGDTNIVDPHCRYLIHIAGGSPIGVPATHTFRFSDFSTRSTPQTSFNLTISSNIGYFLFPDTKYGICTEGERNLLSNFIDHQNDKVLDDLKVDRIRVSDVTSAMYLNSSAPTNIVKSNVAKTVKVKKTTKKVLNESAELDKRINVYNRWSNTPSYVLINHAIKNGKFHNKFFIEKLVASKPIMNILKGPNTLVKRKEAIVANIANEKELLVKNINDTTQVLTISRKIKEYSDSLQNIEEVCAKIL